MRVCVCVCVSSIFIRGCIDGATIQLGVAVCWLLFVTSIYYTGITAVGVYVGVFKAVIYI